jgi:hypothetical protein
MTMRLYPLLSPWLLFPALSGADLGLTWWLLGQEPAAFYESNPLADWFLGRFGWSGLALFKLALVLLVLGTAAAITRRRPRAGGQVLGGGCAVVAAVVAYSAVLAGHADTVRDPHLPDAVAGARLKQRLDHQMELANRHNDLKNELSRALRQGRCSLPEAVERLMTSELADDAQWLRHLKRIYRLDAPRDCWATCLLRQALLDLGDDLSAWERHAPGWIAAYRAHFRVASPPPWEEFAPAGFCKGIATDGHG